MSRNMTQSDAELVYEMLNDAARGDVEAEAFSRTLNTWSGDRPDDLDALETAHEDDSSSFQWEDMHFETSPDYDGDLVPLAGVEPTNEEDVYELANDFGWAYLNEIRDEIRSMQESTDYSSRQFVALVLEAADHCPEEVAASKMDISVGNYRGKLGDVKDKHETAEETVAVTNRIRA